MENLSLHIQKIMSEYVAKEGTDVFFLVLAVLPLVFFIFKRFKASQSLPPGPRPLPIIGNLHQVGKKPHIAFAEFAKTYGPIISVQLGSHRAVIGSSPAAAAEILKTYDRILSGRHKPDSVTVSKCESQNGSIGWAPECNDHWKHLRRICRVELFSGKAVDSQASLREKKSMELATLIGRMEGKVVNIGEIAFATVFNTVTNLLFSRDFIELSSAADGTKSVMRGLLRDLSDVSSAPNISDLYPILAGLDLQSIRHRVIDLSGKICALWAPIAKERRERKGKANPEERDFLDALIEDGFTDDQINQLSLELFSAGTETSTATIEWLMAELIRNPKAMATLQEELARAIKQDVLIESEIICLPYLQACVKEALRLHPPAPLLLPHRAVETCQVMNYTIPKNTQVIVNAWAIGRDPANWEDAAAFKPERFLNSQVDFGGNDFEYLPFGSGRRICPGLAYSAKQVPLVVAAMVSFFNWSLPPGNDPAKMDMGEKFGIVLQKEQSLYLIPRARK